MSEKTTTGDNLEFWREWERQQKMTQPNIPSYTYPNPVYPTYPNFYPDVCPGCGRCRHCGGWGPQRISWEVTC